MPSSEPRWTGMRSACAMVRPCGSNSTVEQSCRSLMLVEKAARMIALPISSTMVDSALPMTSTVTGSTAGADALLDVSSFFISALDQNIEKSVDRRGLAGKHERRRVHLLDDRGSADPVAGAKPVAIVDRAGDEALRGRKIDLPLCNLRLTDG